MGDFFRDLKDLFWFMNTSSRCVISAMNYTTEYLTNFKDEMNEMNPCDNFVTFCDNNQQQTAVTYKWLNSVKYW